MPRLGPESSDALLRRLEWQLIRRLDGLLQGDYRTLFRGDGIDLADLREYQHHDDVRHIDWNVTARLQTPYVRQFTEDRDLTAWFLLDVSGSVDFGSGDVTKLNVATGLVATLARVLTRHGNRVGALLWDQSLEVVLPPKASRLHVLELLQRLRKPRPREAAKPASARNKDTQPSNKTNDKSIKPAAATGTALAQMLQSAGALMKRRSLVFVVSDFISQPGWETALARLSLRHEVVAVRLWDPLEMELPDDASLGLVTVQDAETGEQLFVDAGDPGFRERYAQIAQAQQDLLLQGLMASGADVLELATDDVLLDSLLRFADLRKQRARLPASRRMPVHLRRGDTLASQGVTGSPAPGKVQPKTERALA